MPTNCIDYPPVCLPPRIVHAKYNCRAKMWKEGWYHGENVDEGASVGLGFVLAGHLDKEIWGKDIVMLVINLSL